MKTVRKTAFTTEELAEMYVGHRDMAHAIANKFAPPGHPLFQTVHDEAESLLGLIIARWHEGGEGQAPYNGACSPRTWLYRILYWQLQTFLRKNSKPITHFSTYDKEDEAYEPGHRPNWLHNLLRDCGEDARFLIKTLVHAPIELVDLISVGARARTRNVVREWLQTRCDWTPEEVDRTWDEVAACLV